MRVAVIATAANETSLELVERWRSAGIEAVLVGPHAVRYDDLVLGRLDVTRDVDGVEAGLLELLLLERRGVRVLNGAAALARAHDKLLTTRALTRAGVPQPWTVYLHPRRPPSALPTPLVVKPRVGSWGTDVFLCETPADVAACVRTVRGRPWFRRRGALLQELVPPVGRDLRILVAGGRVVGAEQRIAAPGEWRTNVSLGGSTLALDPPADACRLALAAAAAVGGDLLGVDLLPRRDGYAVVEVNGAIEFDDGYSLAGGDVFLDAAAALGLPERLPAAAG